MQSACLRRGLNVKKVLSPSPEAPFQLAHAEFDHGGPTIGSAVGQLAAEQFIKHVPSFFERGRDQERSSSREQLCQPFEREFSALHRTMQQLIEQFADKAQNSTLGSTRTTLAPCRVRAAWLPASANSALRYSEKCRICSHCIPTSDLRPPTSDLRPPTSVLRPPTSDLCPLSSVLCSLLSALIRIHFTYKNALKF